MAVRQRVMYVELKTGYHDDGPAWITRVRFSKSGRSVYFKGRLLHRTRGVSGNYYDPETGEEFWVSGVKKDGADRHWAGRGPVEIDPDAKAEYERITGRR